MFHSLKPKIQQPVIVGELTRRRIRPNQLAESSARSDTAVTFTSPPMEVLSRRLFDEPPPSVLPPVKPPAPTPLVQSRQPVTYQPEALVTTFPVQQPPRTSIRDYSHAEPQSAVSDTSSSRKRLIIHEVSSAHFRCVHFFQDEEAPVMPSRNSARAKSPQKKQRVQAVQGDSPPVSAYQFRRGTPGAKPARKRDTDEPTESPRRSRQRTRGDGNQQQEPETSRSTRRGSALEHVRTRKKVCVIFLICIFLCS